MLHGIVPAGIGDHYDSASGLKRCLTHYPPTRHAQPRKVKDEQHKLENAVLMLNGTETYMNNVKRLEWQTFSLPRPA